MKKLTEEDITSNAIESWGRTYGFGKYNRKPTYAPSWMADIWDKLCDINEPTKIEIDSIIGNDSWTCVQCDECGSKVFAVAVFETSEFPLQLCADCLNNALLLIKEEQQ